MYPYHNEHDFSLHTFEIRLLNGHKADYYKAFANAFDFCIKNKMSMYDPNKKKKKYYNELVIDVDINNALNDSPIEKETKCEVYVCEALSCVGLTVTFVRTKKFGVPVDYDIRMVINPRRIMGDDTYVGILDVHRIDDMLCAIYTAFEFIGSEHLRLDFFRLHRIDFCCNVFMENQFLVESYIAVLKKCFAPQGYKWNEVGGEEQGIRLKDGVTISTDTLAINAYNKHAYMKKQNGYFNPVHIAEAEGLIRFEIQLYAPRIRYLYKMDDSLNNLLDFFYCCERLSKEHFEEYLPKVFLRGNYFTIEDAREEVECSYFQEPVKNKMLALLNSASVHHSLMKGLDEVIKKYNPPNPYNFTRDLLQKFDEIYLNPVTVPRRRMPPGELFLPSTCNQVLGIETVLFSVLE